jgi:hypothetical protein
VDARKAIRLGERPDSVNKNKLSRSRITRPIPPRSRESPVLRPPYQRCEKSGACSDARGGVDIGQKPQAPRSQRRKEESPARLCSRFHSRRSWRCGNLRSRSSRRKRRAGLKRRQLARARRLRGSFYRSCSAGLGSAPRRFLRAAELRLAHRGRYRILPSCSDHIAVLLCRQHRLLTTDRLRPHYPLVAGGCMKTVSKIGSSSGSNSDCACFTA